MKKFLPGFAAVMLALAASAFTAHKTDTQWVFTGNSQSQILDAASYSQTASPDPSCGSTGELPCTVTFPAGVDNPSALQNYLDNHSAEDITEMSPLKRVE